MFRSASMFSLTLVILAVLLVGAGSATAQGIPVVQPGAPCYSPPPVVSYYYSPPAVFAPAPTVSYYYAPSVSYYPPTVSYYAPRVSFFAPAPAVSYYPAPTAVTTTRYGLFGWPRVTTTYYR